MAKELIKYYILSELMFGRDAYPGKGKIHLDADTKQEDLSYLFNECGMTDCISELELDKGQLESLEKKKRKGVDTKPEKDSAPKKKDKKEDKKEEEILD